MPLRSLKIMGIEFVAEHLYRLRQIQRSISRIGGYLDKIVTTIELGVAQARTLSTKNQCYLSGSGLLQ
jgi:hypothetical protein